MMANPSREVLRALLDSAVLRGAACEARVTQALDPAYWRSLAPELHVDSGNRPAFGGCDAARIEEAAQAVAERGYFHLRDVVPASLLSAANRAVDAVVAAGWPASFACAFDELWWCGHAPALRALITCSLGDGYAHNPRVWIHVVRPVAGSSGWQPHQDGDVRGRLSAWVALTDATLHNGCMHLLPREARIAHLLDRMSREDTFSVADVGRLLQSARALPAAAGDVLGWDFSIWHWGGRAEPGAPERRALSLEFLAEGQPPIDCERPLLPLDRLPAPQERLVYIARGVMEFAPFEPGLARFSEVAQAIRARTGDV